MCFLRGGVAGGGVGASVAMSPALPARGARDGVVYKGTFWLKNNSPLLRSNKDLFFVNKGNYLGCLE